VYAVLRSESLPGWSVEVNKALAVSCRSYAMAMMERALPGALYHVKSSNIHQQYNLYGDHDNKKVRDAVEQTRGVCLTYRQRPVLAMYDSCCGGLVPALIDELDFKKAPYLARSYACHYCKKSSLYEWKVACEKSNLIALLKKIDVSVKNISHMSISKRDKAGVVKSVKIKDGKKELIISGKAVYSVIKGIKSFAFSIKYTKNQIEFFGTGYGHPYGLCQWGACEMVKQGSLFDAVLKFYYPGTELKSMGIKELDESFFFSLYYSEIKLNTVYCKG
jgi:stage II sporulation protein D